MKVGGGVVEQRDFARQGAGDFLVDGIAALLQLGYARGRIRLGAGGHLAKEFEKR